jgi:hypothetical protein
VSAGIPNRSRRLALFAACIVMNVASAAIAADDAPTPTIERTGDWRAAVHRFVEANMKHPAWGLSHSVRDYELAKELMATDRLSSRAPSGLP